MSSDDGTFVGDSEGSEQFFDASPVPPKPQPLFPTLSRPIHVDPAALASVPEPAQGCIILDPTSKLNALEAYDEGAMLFLQDPAAPPSDFTDPYVYPRLTKNERDRLTALWYYTRDIHEDKVFLAHMQETLELLQDLIPRDHVIVGLSDKDSYINIAATHMPLAITNRKETLCSHTINMPGGTVLSIEDLKEDWRLKNNPHVTHGGVGSYVGTPLHCQVPGLDGSDSDVALGTLCATSSAPAEPLTATQQKALIRFSKIIVHDMIARARSIRSNERQAMAATLAELSKEVTATNADELVLSTLRRTYPDTHVSIQRRPDGCIQLEGSEPVSYANLQGYLYEDTEQIDRDVLVANHIPNDAQPISRTLRAVAVKLTASQDSYLVVQTTRLTSIFDDIDSNFVHTCALILSNVRQAAELERAAAAKAVFLRGVSHELRTPIHALLSSCELLVEEVKAGRVAIVRGFQEGDALSNATESAELLHNALASGRALLTTVNNLLNFDTLESITPIHAPFSLAGLEASLVEHAVTALQDQGADVEVVCVHALPLGVHVLNTDLDLLRQALGAVIDNAISFTPSGTITLRTSLVPSDAPDAAASLVYDITDTGSGISPEEQELIFTPFGVGQLNSSKSTGLGLAVAARIATNLSGQLELVESGPNGTHFRLTLRGPTLSAQLDHVGKRLAQEKLETFGVLGGSGGVHVDAAKQFLAAVGLVDGRVDHPTLLIADASSPSLSTDLQSLSEDQFVLLLYKDEHIGPPATTIASAVGVTGRLVAVPTPTTAERMWAGMDSILDLMHKSRWKQAVDGKSPGILTSTATSWTLSPSGRAWTRATLRVLVVDDNKTNLDILCMFCRRRKHSHVSAVNGALAVDAFKQTVSDGSPVTLVLMDLQMPVMDGVEAIRLIRAYEAEQGFQPCLIYMVTGQSHETDKLHSLQAGADGYYVKPLSMRTLDDLIALHFPVSRT